MPFVVLMSLNEKLVHMLATWWSWRFVLFINNVITKRWVIVCKFYHLMDVFCVDNIIYLDVASGGEKDCLFRQDIVFARVCCLRFSVKFYVDLAGEVGFLWILDCVILMWFDMVTVNIHLERESLTALISWRSVESLAVQCFIE